MAAAGQEGGASPPDYWSLSPKCNLPKGSSCSLAAEVLMGPAVLPKAKETNNCEQFGGSGRQCADITLGFPLSF